MMRLLGWVLFPFALAALFLITVFIGIFDRDPHYRRNQLDPR